MTSAGWSVSAAQAHLIRQCEMEGWRRTIHMMKTAVWSVSAAQAHLIRQCEMEGWRRTIHMMTSAGWLSFGGELPWRDILLLCP